MKYKREYCFGGFDGKTNEDDFVVGYQAENGRYIKCEFSISCNRAIGYTVYADRKRSTDGKREYIRAFDLLKDAKTFVEV